MDAAIHFLAKDCFVCKMGCHWIILCRSRDKYLCVADAELASIADRLAGWEAPRPAMTRSSTQERQANGLIESLTSNGIITTNPSSGKPFIESQYPAPKGRMEMPRSTAKHKISFSWIVRFIFACVTVDWLLRRNALPRTLVRLECRRLRAESSREIHSAANASTLVAAFKVLRPFYPRPYLCLFESLALLEFLANYNFHPRVVFGVVADPFQAHCWLQEGSTILDDDLERVGRYMPILSV